MRGGLNIGDALLYLDQIKAKTSAPVYNEFLGIMQQFKSQSISTLSVIERVKTLLKGRNYHPFKLFDSFSLLTNFSRS